MNKPQKSPEKIYGDTTKNLVVLNDEHNTFQHVIACLVLYCKHDPIQAEQCATIVHYNGKCQVKSGSAEEIQGLEIALKRNGLTVTIE